MTQQDDKKIEITKEQAEEILDAGSPRDFHWGDVPVRCNHCHASNQIKNIQIEKYGLNDLYDVIVEGKCASCGGRIWRYLETGEIKSSKIIAKIVWRDNEL